MNDINGLHHTFQFTHKPTHYLDRATRAMDSVLTVTRIAYIG